MRSHEETTGLGFDTGDRCVVLQRSLTQKKKLKSGRVRVVPVSEDGKAEKSAARSFEETGGEFEIDFP